MRERITHAWQQLRDADGVFLILVTLAGGAMRFAWLSRPTLWNDEAQTYWRACGSQRDLLAILRGDGFGPLHYELTWLIGRYTTLTPFWMRFVPALCGTLMVPAVYWLAAELFNRRVARVAAVFACCSAFLLVYSRDAKMYMQTWFAITLFAACLFGYVRTGRWPIAVLGWLAGSAAMWLHATGFVVVPLTILAVLLDRRVKPRQAAWVLAGLCVMGVGPLWYFIEINRVVPSMTVEPGMGLRGVGWVTHRTAGHSAASLVTEIAGAYAYAFYWIDEKAVAATRVGWLMIADALLLSAVAVAGLLAVLLPDRSDQTPRRLTAGPLFLVLWGALPVYALFRFSGFKGISFTDTLNAFNSVEGAIALGTGVATFVVTSLMAGRDRVRFALLDVAVVLVAGSIALPAVRAVMLDPDYPDVAPAWVAAVPVPLVVTVAALAVLLAVAWRETGPSFMARFRQVRPGVGVVIVLLVAMFAVDHFSGGRSPGSMWMPRYVGFTFPALLIGAAALCLRLRPAPLRWTAVGLLLAVNVTQFTARLVVDTDPPIDRVAADVLSPEAKQGRTLVYTRDASQIGGPTATGSIVNSVGRYYLYTQSGLPVSPRRFLELPVPLRMTWSPAEIAQEAEGKPEAKRIIVWDRLPNSSAIEDVAASRALPSPWQRVSEQRFTVRTFWHWGTLYLYRRSEYVR